MKTALASLILLTCAASTADAQGVNAEYLPFPQGRLQRFPLKRYAFPPGAPMDGKPFTVSGVTMRDAAARACSRAG